MYNLQHMKQIYIIVAVVALAAMFIAGLWALYQSDEVNNAETVTDERKQECDAFMTVALFPDDGFAATFLENCYKGEPVLPTDVPNTQEEIPSAGVVDLAPQAGPGCAIGGCSSQLCGEEGEVEDMVTTCEWREEYACYASSRCEKQADGVCGWTETEEYTQCMASAGGTTSN